MNITIDRQSGITVTEQVRLEFMQRIRSGLLEEGQLLPSVRQLSKQLQISLVTAHQVYRALQKDGLIASIPGKGTFVRSKPVPAAAPSAAGPTAESPFDWQLSVLDYLPRASFWSQSVVRLPSAIMDLSNASIHHTLLPLALLQASIKHAVEACSRSLGSYSPYQGDPDFLGAVSRYLLDQGIAISRQHMIVTNGTQQGLDLFARTFLGPGDVVAVETPCFSGAIDVFRLSHATIQPVAVDRDGIRIDLLNELSTRMKIKAIYTVPTCQNPTGTIMSYKRRRELLAFAQENNAIIVEDDPHRELAQPAGKAAPPVPDPLKSLDTTGRVVYLKGFSKFLFPGLRIGIIAADGTLYTRLLATKSIADLGSPLWLQKALIHLFANPQLAAHIHTLNQSLSRRRTLVINTLAAKLHPAIRFTPPSGGMHLWLTLPFGISADELIPQAHVRGIHFLPGSIFYPGEAEANHLRICWTNLSDQDLPQALEILCTILNEAVKDFG